MSVSFRRNPFFTADVQKEFGWYWDEAGERIAWRFEEAVEQTLRRIARQPGIGRPRQFSLEKAVQPQRTVLRCFRWNRWVVLGHDT